MNELKNTSSSIRRQARANTGVKSSILSILILLLTLPQSSQLFATDLVRVIREEQANEAHLYIQNDGIVDATISFKFDLDNARLDHRTRTLIIGSGERVRAFTVTRKKTDKPWRYQYRYRWRWGHPDARHDKSFVYRLPFGQGTSVFVGQGFKGTFSHGDEQKYAIDWTVPVGTPVHAARGGLVVAVESRYSRGGTSANFLNAANYIVVKHDDGTFGNYLHFMKDGVAVQVGQTISTGELIGYSGNTGFSTEPHLHFHVYEPDDGWKSEPVKIKFTTREGDDIVLKQGKTYTVK
jgi:murein DD-endopeptidase MepM/ murein hydrolase activator NlpD